MKGKNIMPKKEWQQTLGKFRWKELGKRLLVIGLTVAMVGNTVDLSALSVSAKVDEGVTTVVSFEELSEDITGQTLPVGAPETDISFPDSLTVAVERTAETEDKSVSAGNADDAENTGVSGNEGMTEKVCLEDIKWELDAEESDAAEFDSSEASEGLCYAYTPVLPETDGDGNRLVLGEGVALPAIYVLIGGYGIATLDESSGEETSEEYAVELTIEDTQEQQHYTAITAALDAISDAGEGEFTLKLLKGVDNESFIQREIGKSGQTITIDLNGCQIGYIIADSESNEWQTDIDKYGFTIGAGTVIFTDSSEAKTGYLHGTLQMNGGSVSMEGGTYEVVEADAGAALKATGSTEIKTLSVQHMSETRAEVELSGGHYGKIAVAVSDIQDETAVNTALSDETKKLAIVDMLAEGYAFYNSEDEEQEIARATTTAVDLTVGSTSADETNAAVRIEATKADGTGVETTYYRTWKAAAEYLSGKDYVDVSKTELFETWKSVRVVLLKDVKIDSDVEQWDSVKLPDITVCSETGSVYTLTGTGSNYVLDCGGMNVTLENIKIADGCIWMGGSGWQKLTLESGVEVSGAPSGKYTRATIRVSDCDLVLNEAKVICTTEGMYAVDLYDATLYMSGNKTELASAYIAGDSNHPVTAVIDANAAGDGSTVPVFTAESDQADLIIYYTGIHAQFDTALANYNGKVKEWYQIELHDGVTLAEGKNADTVTTFEGNTYGLFRENKTERFTIYVGDDACYYSTHQLTGSAEPGGSWAFNSNNPSFRMPQSKAHVYRHDWRNDGSCSKFSSCMRINLAVAYENGNLEIEGLEGRTYDSYPQILSKITWKSRRGDTEVLTAPTYQDARWPESKWKPLGVGGEDPLFSNAEYTVVYKNNTNPYSYAPGDEGFNPDEAPQVKISGYGSYYCGSFTVYFTIGKGEMRLGDFKVLGAAGDIIYNGMPHKAWDNNAVEYKLDAADRGQFTQLDEDETYIPACDRTNATNTWCGDSWENPTQVEYSKDGGQTWNVEMAYGREGDMENAYMITDAGEHPFYIKVTNKACGELISEELMAKITPRSFDSNGITFDKSASVTAYFTGNPILPTDWDDKIVDDGLDTKVSYTLEKDKDFTVSGENNTDLTTDGNKATIILTGTGNYQGTLTAEFDIKNAFTLAQTDVSKNMWYKNDYYCQDGGVPVRFFDLGYNTSAPSNERFLVYRDSSVSDVTLGDKVEFYTSVEDAAAGTDPGYTFREEGTHTVTLYGKDPDTGYISAPVDITLSLDTTAPTWADKDGNEDGYGIRISESWWRKLLNTVSFGFFYNNHTLEINIKANDEKNGVTEVSGNPAYYCYIQRVSAEEASSGEFPVKTREELDALWENKAIETDYFNGFTRVGLVGRLAGKLSTDGNYIVYARAVDNAGNGNAGDYICTEGIVIDTQNAEYQLVLPDKEAGTLRDTEVTFKLTGITEDMDLLYYYVPEKEIQEELGIDYDTFKTSYDNYLKNAADNSESYAPLAKEGADGKWSAAFTENGTLGTVLAEGYRIDRPMYCVSMKKGEGEITITDLEPNESCIVRLVCIDRAGNIAARDFVEFTTTKPIPRVETLPKVSGVYGDTAAELKVTRKGVARYGDAEIKGSWTVTDTGSTPLRAGETVQCEVTFTPDASYNGEYENTVLYVETTIQKRPLTIYVEDMRRMYGSSVMPELNFMIPDLMGNKLFGTDTIDTIRETLLVEVTETVKDPNAYAGRYAFYVKSNSENYEVTVKYYETLEDTTKDVEYGLFIIEKADGEINQTSDFKAVQDVQYRYDGDFATFNLGVTANHEEAQLEYTVTDAKKADGEAIAAEDVENKLLSIAADGTVTLKGAGSATVTISLPESVDYTAAASVTVQVNIAKDDVTIPEFTRSSIYTVESPLAYDLVSANGLNAERLGAITYGTGNNDEAISGMGITINGTAVSYEEAKAEFFAVLPKLSDTSDEICLTIGSQTAYTAKTAIVTIPAVSENCVINGGNGVIFNLTIVDQKEVKPQAEVGVTGTLTYGEPLSKLSFVDVVFCDTTDESIIIPGTLEWSVPEKVLEAGAHEMEYVFKPSLETVYKQYVGHITVTVNKAKATVESTPVPGEFVYCPQLSLSEDILNAGAKTQGVVTDIEGKTIAGAWRFVDSEVLLHVAQVGSGSYEICFEPESSFYEKNYDFTDVKANVSITVKKAVPYISVEPSVENAYTHGDSLDSQTLTGEAVYGDGMGGAGAMEPVAGTFTWKEPSTRLSYVENQGKTYEYTFTPEDTASYEVLTGAVAVTVNKAQIPPRKPASEINVEYSCAKVSEVELPSGWVWDENDVDKELIAGTTITVTARYNESDAPNYENVAFSIQITRSNCEHEKTEVRDVAEATCSAEGYTGDTWCLVCSEKVSSGSVIPKNAEKHTALTSTVIKQPTTTEEGTRLYECKDCGYSRTESIAKLEGGDPTPTPAPTATPAPTPTAAPTPTPTAAPTPTPTAAPTPTPTAVPTPTPMAAPTPTPTAAPTPTPTAVPTPTPTAAPTPTAVPTPTPTTVPTPTPTAAPTPTPTAAPTAVPTPTPTAAPTPTPTAAPAPGATATPMPTATPAPGATATPTPTATPAPGATATPTPTATPAPGATATPTPTATPAPGATATPTPTATPAPGATATPTPTVTPAPAATAQPSQMPFLRGEDGKEGWDVIKSEIKVCTQGEMIVVDMNGTGIVPGDVFDEIRGKDITITFDLGNGISWQVNGNSVQADEVGNIDFTVKFGEEASDAIPVDIINALTGERSSMNLTLAYEGTFGFEASLCINVGTDNKGLVANLFYYNESTGELEFISAGEIDENGSAMLSFTHASDYTIVIDVASMGETGEVVPADTVIDTDSSDAAPTQEVETSSTKSKAALIWLIAFAGIAAAVTIGIVVVKRRKEEE